MRLPEDPISGDGLAGFGRRLRRREISTVEAVRAYLARIDILDPHLLAYAHLDHEGALKAAVAIDALLEAGTDLGPLMGVPVAVKDIIAVDGMPTAAGSNIDVGHIIGGEGSFIRRLRQAGCIILGKANTVEFAIGSSGTNYSRGTPRNPWDAETFRLASGSSSGSAVAVSAGLCGFSIGTDTGGSIRGPAAFCGVFGLKTTYGAFPLDGIFPMSKTLDTLGPITRSASDAALVWAALTGDQRPQPRSVRTLRLGQPSDFFFDGLAEEVALCMDRALGALGAAGAEIVPFGLPEVHESNTVFTTISRAELVAVFGRERFLALRERMNPDVGYRIAPGLEVSSEAYIQAIWHHRKLQEIARRSFESFDAWVAPTKQRAACSHPGPFTTWEADQELIALCAGPTRSANAFGLCATSQPIQQLGAALPVGLQVLCAGGADRKLLSIALALEEVLGAPQMPDLSGFLRKGAAEGGQGAADTPRRDMQEA